MSRYKLNVPEGWERIEYLCYPGNGSKGYKSTQTNANCHVVNMYDSGAFVVNGENGNGEAFDERYHDYFDALAHVRGWMLKHD